MIEKPDVEDAVILRALEDLYSIEATALEILDVRAGEETRLNSLRWFKTLFDAGSSVPVALAETLTGLEV